MLTLDATLATKSANSYVTVVYCDEYWGQHYSATKAAQWLALSTTQKQALLIQACRIIERVRFTANLDPSSDIHLFYDRSTQKVMQVRDDELAVKYNHFQSLQFPRNLDRDPDTGTLYIPEAIKMAQCEQAAHILSFDESALANRLQGIESDSVAVGTVRTSQTYGGAGSMLAPMALEFINPFVMKSGRLRRG